MTGNTWRLPEDRPPVAPARPRPNDSEDFQLGDVVDWLKSEDKSIERVTCLLLENMVDGLINGGRYIYATKADAPAGQGIPELEVLQECNINCYVQKSQARSKGLDIPVTVKVAPGALHTGYDEDIEILPPRTIGPRQSGPPPDIILHATPVWVLEYTPEQREATLLNALLCIVPDERGNLTRWKTVSPDIVVNSLVVQLYGALLPMGALAIQSARTHTPQMYLPGMTPPEKQAALNSLLREAGIKATYKDGRLVTGDGEVVE